MQQEISRPLREELSEIKEILKSVQKDIDTIKRNKMMEDKVYDQWIGQYDVDISEPPYDYDPEPYVPTQGCSQREILEATREHAEWEKRHGLR